MSTLIRSSYTKRYFYDPANMTVVYFDEGKWVDVQPVYITTRLCDISAGDYAVSEEVVKRIVAETSPVHTTLTRKDIVYNLNHEIAPLSVVGYDTFIRMGGDTTTYHRFRIGFGELAYGGCDYTCRNDGSWFLAGLRIK